MSKRVNNKKGNRAKRGSHYAHHTKVRAGALTDGNCEPRLSGKQKKRGAMNALKVLMDKYKMTAPVNVGTPGAIQNG